MFDGGVLRKNFQILTGVFFLVVIGSAYYTLRGNDPISYKATTVDECIREMECVWYAFSQIAKFREMPDRSSRMISKWGRDIQIYTVGDSKGLHNAEIQQALDTIQPHIPIKISQQKPFNLLILFSDDIVNDVMNKYREEFRKTLGSDVIASEVGRINQKDIECFFINFHSPDEGYLWFGVILTKNAPLISSWCIPNALFRTTLVKDSLHDFPFSGAWGLRANNGSPTSIDYILLDILYDPRFDGVKSLDDARPVFERVYQESLSQYNQ